MKCVHRQSHFSVWMATKPYERKTYEGHDYGVYAPGASPYEDDLPEYAANTLADCIDYIDENANLEAQHG